MKRSSADIIVSITDGNGRLTDDPPGVLAALAGVLSLNGISKEKLTEEGYAYGDDFVFFEAVGINRVGDIQLSMFLDDDETTGNLALFDSDAGSEYRSLKIEYGSGSGSLYQTMDVVISAVNIITNKGETIKLEVTLKANSDLITAWVA